MTRADLMERLTYGEYILWLAHFELTAFERKRAADLAGG